jgi:hypothetical protein
MFGRLIDEPGPSAGHSQQLHPERQAITIVVQQATHA